MPAARRYSRWDRRGLTYDALDRRVYKSSSQGATYFIYAPSGQLLYEQSSQRTVDYVWLAGRLVGISINHGALQSVHTDWLGRPELVTGTTSPTVAWRASNAVYDRHVTLDNIGGLNFFLPGQYYDSESDLYYNWHRYYDPTSGRYIQSDPIGLQGGINTYAYVNGSPVNHTDPSGLMTDSQFDRWAAEVGCMSGKEKAGFAAAGVGAAVGGFAIAAATADAGVTYTLEELEAMTVEELNSLMGKAGKDALKDFFKNGASDGLTANTVNAYRVAAERIMSKYIVTGNLSGMMTQLQ